MDSLIVACTISVTDAIHAGSSRAGAYDHVLTDAQAKAICEEGLTLAAGPYLVAAESVDAGHRDRLRISAPSWEGVLAALRIQNERASDTRRRHRLEREFLAEWDGDQHRLHEAGILSESEMLETARRVAFAKFDELFTRFAKQYRRPSVLGHSDDCPVPVRSRDGQDEHIDRSVVGEEAEVSLSPEQWSEFKHVCRMVSDRNQDAPIAVGFTAYNATLRMHTMRCRSCGSTKVQNTVLVTITWCGRPLSREYLLAR